MSKAALQSSPAGLQASGGAPVAPTGRKLGAQTISGEVPPPNRSDPMVQTFARPPPPGAQGAAIVALGAGIALCIAGVVTDKTSSIVFGAFLLILTVLIAPLVLVATTFTIDVPYQRLIVNSKPVVPLCCKCAQASTTAWPLNGIASVTLEKTKRKSKTRSKGSSGPTYALTLHFVDGSSRWAESAASNVDVEGRRRFAALLNDQLQRVLAQYVPGRSAPQAVAAGAACAGVPQVSAAAVGYQGQANGAPFPPQGGPQYPTATANPYGPAGPAMAGAGGQAPPQKGAPYGSGASAAQQHDVVAVKAPPEQGQSVLV